MLEQTIKNTRRRSIPEAATTESAKPKTLPLIIENNGRLEVGTLKLGDTSLEETIQTMDKGEPILVASKHPIGKKDKDIIKVVILTATYLSDKEPYNLRKKSPVTHLDQDMSKPWYFTHI